MVCLLHLKLTAEYPNTLPRLTLQVLCQPDACPSMHVLAPDSTFREHARSTAELRL